MSVPIYIYKKLISPILPHTCRYYPTCSSYALDAIFEFGCFKGFKLTIKRLFSCHPKSKRNRFDPIPINLKGESKWLF